MKPKDKQNKTKLSFKKYIWFNFIRMFEACGNSAFLTGSFSAIAREFPTRVASMFSLIELFFGIGKSYLSNRIPRIIK